MFLHKKYPENHLRVSVRGADDGTRTHDLILTKDVLYRLSYISALLSERKEYYISFSVEKQ